MKIIRNAKFSDLKAVEKLAELNTIKNTNDIKGGFLVSGYTEKEYSEFIEKGFYFYVAIDETNEIIGALIAYDSDDIKNGDLVNSLVRNSIKKKFILIKQIFTDPNQKSKGISTNLYNHMYDDISTNIAFAASIVGEPFNLASVNFHKKQGFEKILTIVPDADPDGIIRPRDIWYKKESDDIESELRIKFSF